MVEHVILLDCECEGALVLRAKRKVKLTVVGVLVTLLNDGGPKVLSLYFALLDYSFHMRLQIFFADQPCTWSRFCLLAVHCAPVSW